MPTVIGSGGADHLHRHAIDGAEIGAQHVMAADDLRQRAFKNVALDRPSNAKGAKCIEDGIVRLQMLQQPLPFLHQRQRRETLIGSAGYFCGAAFARNFSPDSFFQERLLVRRQLCTSALPNSLVHLGPSGRNLCNINRFYGQGPASLTWTYTIYGERDCVARQFLLDCLRRFTG